MKHTHENAESGCTNMKLFSDLVILQLYDNKMWEVADDL